MSLSDVAGTWEGQTLVGPKDSVGATWTLTATADRNGWTLTYPNREPVPIRVLSARRHTVVYEAGPFESVLRPGQQVTVHCTARFRGKTMAGTFRAKYPSGDVLHGKIKATRNE
jgi:hypothetical protein